MYNGAEVVISSAINDFVSSAAFHNCRMLNCPMSRLTFAMRKYLPLIMTAACCVTGCGDSATTPTTTGTATNGAAATDVSAKAKADEGAPPARAKIPSDDLFATMVQAFAEGKGDLYKKTETQLDKLGAEAIPTYEDALEGGEVEARKLACMRLAFLGPDAAPATDTLAVALNDKEPFVRANAASVLSVVSSPPETLLPALVAILKDDNARDWHGMSIVAMSNLGTLASDAVPDLIPFLKSAKSDYRRDTLKTLKAIGPAAKPYLGEIKSLYKDEVEEVATTAKEVVTFIESIDRETEQVGQMDMRDTVGPGDDTGPPPPMPKLELPGAKSEPPAAGGGADPEPEPPAEPTKKDN